MSVFLNLLIVITNFGLIRSSSMLIGSQGKFARIDRYTPICPEYPNAPMIFTFNNMTIVGTKASMKCKIIIKEDIPNTKLMAHINIQRCRSKESLDTCQNFHKLTLDDYCNSIMNLNSWNQFYSNFKPPYQCPFKKGVYLSDNSELDVGAILMFPVDGWFWKIRSEIRDATSKKVIMCSIGEAKIAFKN